MAIMQISSPAPPETALLAQKSGWIILVTILEYTTTGYVVRPIDEVKTKVVVDNSDPTMKLFRKGTYDHSEEIIDWIMQPELVSVN